MSANIYLFYLWNVFFWGTFVPLKPIFVLGQYCVEVGSLSSKAYQRRFVLSLFDTKFISYPQHIHI